MPTDDASELESILASAETETSEATSATQGYAQDQGHGDMLSNTSKQQDQSAQNQPKMFAGKYKTPEELEKAYTNAQSLIGKTSSRAKQLEAIVRDPRIQQMAAQDPKMRETLGKLGFELRTAESEEDARNEQQYGGNPNDPDFKIAMLEAKTELKWELFEFGQDRGKPLSKDERSAVIGIIRSAPSLTIEQAYRLTPFYEQGLKAAEDKRVAEVNKRGQVQRPKPNPTFTPTGQSVDLKKNVTQMNDTERRAYLEKIVSENP